MTTFARIMNDLSLGRPTDYVRRVAKAEKSAQTLDATEYRTVIKTCHEVDSVRGREWRL